MPNDELVKLMKQLNGQNKVVAESFLTWLLEKQLDEEDDTLTSEDIEAIGRARLEYKNGETMSLEDVKRELQL
jgi:hypothetical protein